MQKRLYKIEKGKKICGVCGGIAEYFDIIIPQKSEIEGALNDK